MKLIKSYGANIRNISFFRELQEDMSSVASTRDLVGTGRVNWSGIKATIMHLPPPAGLVSAAGPPVIVPAAPVRQHVKPEVVRPAQPAGPIYVPHGPTVQPTDPVLYSNTGGPPTGSVVPPALFIQPSGPASLSASSVPGAPTAIIPSIQSTGPVAGAPISIEPVGPAAPTILPAQSTEPFNAPGAFMHPAGSTLTHSTSQLADPGPFVATPAVPTIPPSSTTQTVPAAPPRVPTTSKKRKNDDASADSSKRTKQDKQPDSEDDVTPQPVRAKPAPKRTYTKKDPNAPKAPRKPRKIKTPEVVEDPETTAVGEPNTEANPAPENVEEIWQVRYTQKKCDVIYEATAALGDKRCSGCVFKEVEVCWAVRGLSCIPCKKAKRACNLDRETKPVGLAVPKLQGLSALPVAPGTDDELRGKLLSYFSAVLLTLTPRDL